MKIYIEAGYTHTLLTYMNDKLMDVIELSYLWNGERNGIYIRAENSNYMEDVLTERHRQEYDCYHKAYTPISELVAYPTCPKNILKKRLQLYKRRLLKYTKENIKL